MDIVEKNEIEINSEKFIVTGLIVSDQFCKSLVPILKNNLDLLKIPYVKTVSKWCIDFFLKYSKCAGKNIQDIFNENSTEQNDNSIELIGEFLHHISNNYEREENFNELYAIEQAKNYLTKRKLHNTKMALSNAIKSDKINDAEDIITNYQKLTVFKDSIGIDILNDKKSILDALHETEEVLFRMPGALGDCLHDFVRGDLIAFAAPAKRGKTFWLIDIAIRALLNKLRVVFFSFEMTEGQNIKRICQNYLGELKSPIQNGGFLEIDIPIFEQIDEEEKFTISYKKAKKYGIQQKEIFQKLNGIKRISKGGAFRLICSPPNSMTIDDISDCIDGMVMQEGFVPDVLVLDYADIILSTKRGDHRHEIDNVWKGSKRLALDKHCLVITASHSNKSTFNRDISQSDLSEDYRKMNHVSVMIALNQTFEEKKKGIMRVRPIAHRHEDFSNDDVIVLSNLKIGKPYLDSRFSKDVLNLEK